MIIKTSFLKSVRVQGILLLMTASFLGFSIKEASAGSEHLISVKFSKIYVRDNSEGDCGSNIGELKLVISANDQSKIIRMSVGDNSTYEMDASFNVLLNSNDSLALDIIGTEIDDGRPSWYPCGTGPDDHMGTIRGVFYRNTRWGEGNYATETDKYTIYYSITSRDI